MARFVYMIPAVWVCPMCGLASSVLTSGKAIRSGDRCDHSVAYRETPEPLDPYVVLDWDEAKGLEPLRSYPNMGGTRI